MSFDHLRIRALDGAALVSGTLHLVGADGACAELPEGAILAVVPGPETRLEWVQAIRQDPDGLFTASWRALELRFSGGVPAIEQLGQTQRIGPTLSLASPGAELARLIFDDALSGDGAHGPIDALDLTTKASPDGLSVTISGRLGAMRSKDLQPSRWSGAEVIATFTLPWLYLHLRHSPAEGRDPNRDPHIRGAVEFGTSLRALAVDRYGQAFLQGHLGFGRPVPPYDRGNRCVRARLSSNALQLMLAETPPRLPSGLVGSGGSGGPEMVLLGMGHDTWRRALDGTDQATLAMAGPGIGHIHGQTGNVYEIGGPRTQQVASCSLLLTRGEKALVIELEGKVHPPQGTVDYEPLGPTFCGRMVLPNVLLAIRGIDMQDAFNRRARMLDASGLPRTLVAQSQAYDGDRMDGSHSRPL